MAAILGNPLREMETDGGYPVFRVVLVGSARNRQPKNLVFAPQVKPDTRISDAIDNDIEIVEGADKVLVYDTAYRTVPMPARMRSMPARNCWRSSCSRSCVAT